MYSLYRIGSPCSASARAYAIPILLGRQGASGGWTVGQDSCREKRLSRGGLVEPAKGSSALRTENEISFAACRRDKAACCCWSRAFSDRSHACRYGVSHSH